MFKSKVAFGILSGCLRTDRSQHIQNPCFSPRGLKERLISGKRKTHSFIRKEFFVGQLLDRTFFRCFYQICNRNGRHVPFHKKLIWILDVSTPICPWKLYKSQKPKSDPTIRKLRFTIQIKVSLMRLLLLLPLPTLVAIRCGPLQDAGFKSFTQETISAFRRQLETMYRVPGSSGGG